MTSILVVCTGNVCRSPIAEGLLRNALVERVGQGAPRVSSAGTAGWEGRPAMPESVEAARERGADIAEHVAREVTGRMVEGADLIVTMAREHRDALSRFSPETAHKTFTMKELVRILDSLPAPPGDIDTRALVERTEAAGEARRGGFGGNPADEDVADPLGLPLESFRAVAWELDEWLHRLTVGLYGASPDAVAKVGEA
jgi:protein-tyrosine phosphatase